MKILSPFTGALTAAAMTLTSTAAMAQSQPCQGSGCVLPLPSAPAPAPVVDTAPVPIETAAVGEGKSFGLLPLLLGAALIGLAAYLLLDDDEEPVSP